jgi:hypothetical protein
MPSILKGISLTAEICLERGIVTENYSALSLVPAQDFPYNCFLDSDWRKPEPGL